jgi:hypothetical protein
LKPPASQLEDEEMKDRNGVEINGWNLEGPIGGRPYFHTRREAIAWIYDGGYRRTRNPRAGILITQRGPSMWSVMASNAPMKSLAPNETVESRIG